MDNTVKIDNTDKKKCKGDKHHVFELGKRTCNCGQKTIPEAPKPRFTDMNFR
jgi:hypothetical protein